MEIYSAEKLKTVKLHGRVSSGSCSEWGEELAFRRLQRSFVMGLLFGGLEE